MNKVLVGIDPSYSRTGISVFYKNRILISECKSHSSVKSFEQVYKDAVNQVNRIIQEIRLMMNELGFTDRPEDNKIVYSECPPPQGNWSPGLYALDTLLFYRLEREGFKVNRLYPSYLGHVHGKKKYQKSESVALANKLLSFYSRRVLSKRFSHDEAESVIFLMRNLAANGELCEEIINKYPVFLEQKEVEI